MPRYDEQCFAGGFLRKLRLDAGVGLRELSRRTGFGPGELSKYENGKVGITLDIVDAVADALQLPREYAALTCLLGRYRKLADRRNPIGKAFEALRLETQKLAPRSPRAPN